MSLKDKVESLISPSLEGLGYRVVCVNILSAHGCTVQILIERLDNSGVMVKDCECASRTVSSLLDVDDLIKHSYMLEVSSPGINRPLTKIEDYQRFAGEKAEIELMVPVGDQKKFKGTLKGISGDEVVLEDSGCDYSFVFGQIRKANLVREIGRGLKK